MSEQKLGEAFEIVSEVCGDVSGPCCLCGGLFRPGDINICQIVFDRGCSDFAHLSCARKHPKCLGRSDRDGDPGPRGPVVGKTAAAWYLHFASSEGLEFHSGHLADEQDIDKALEKFIQAVRPVLELAPFAVKEIGIELRYGGAGER
jgi:hypothetical protein